MAEESTCSFDSINSLATKYKQIFTLKSVQLQSNIWYDKGNPILVSFHQSNSSNSQYTHGYSLNILFPHIVPYPAILMIDKVCSRTNPLMQIPSYQVVFKLNHVSFH
jgi:poly(3-hydroxybutyrate) depolymerase